MDEAKIKWALSCHMHDNLEWNQTKIRGLSNGKRSCTINFLQRFASMYRHMRTKYVPALVIPLSAKNLYYIHMNYLCFSQRFNFQFEVQPNVKLTQIELEKMCRPSLPSFVPAPRAALDSRLGNDNEKIRLRGGWQWKVRLIAAAGLSCLG